MPDGGIPIGQRVHITVKYGCRRFLSRPVAGDLNGGQHLGGMRINSGFRSGHIQQAVLEIDDILSGVQILLRHIIKVGSQQLKSFIYLLDTYQFLIVFGDKSLDDTLHHVIGI